MGNYDENSIVTLNWHEAIRSCLGMYIGDASITGLHHLLTEIIANSMDEAAAGYGKFITVKINRADNSATVTDNGRGIPFHRNASGEYAIVEMCTSLHSGGKFDGQSNYKSSLGLHGVGATCTNALSSEFHINVWRDGEHCSFDVYDCEYDDPVIEPFRGQTRGTEVSFIPDPKIFGDLKWDINKIKEELQLHALLNNGITFRLIEHDDTEIIQDVKYCYTNGIKDMLKIKCEGLNMTTSPVYFKTEVEKCVVEMAFAYCDKGYETIYSFVNGGYTPNDGTHVTGWKTAFTTYINKVARDQEILKEKDKNFSGDIVRKGLVLVLSIKMENRPMFAEQTKRTLNSPEARGYCSKAVAQMALQPKEIKQILDKITIEQKAEDAAQRKREAQEKIARGGKSMNSLRDLPEKLADAHDFTDAELFLVEGDSAAAGAKSIKLPNMAILPLRGKVKNCTTLELADAIKSDIIKDLLTVLGCGVGDHFNINNLRYNKIIIMTDADPDGGHIELLLMTLFLHHLPELVKQGKVFAATPPLYRTQTARETLYWRTDNKEFKTYMRNHKTAELQRIKGLGEMSARELFNTTMDPNNRELVQLTTEDMEKTLALYDRLMGKQPSLRRDFIIKNKLSSIADSETYDEEDDEE